MNLIGSSYEDPTHNNRRCQTCSEPYETMGVQQQCLVNQLYTFVLSLCMCVHSSICSLHVFVKTEVPVTRFKDSTYYDLLLISNLDCVVNTLCIGVHVLRIEANGTYLAVI